METKPTREELEQKVKKLEQEVEKSRETEKESQKSIRFLNNIINCIDDPMFVKDKQHKWVLLNDACCRQIGHEREMLIGKGDYDFHPKAEADVFWDKDTLVLQTGKVNLNQENVTYPDGNIHVISTKKSLLTDSETGDKFIVGIIRDVTAQVTLEAERERLIKELQEALAKIKKLKGLIPICASCKKVRSDNGFWQQVEVYVRDHSEANFTHGYCPECAAKLINEG
jgi:PAS domain S-box-containing protein